MCGPFGASLKSIREELVGVMLDKQACQKMRLDEAASPTASCVRVQHLRAGNNRLGGRGRPSSACPSFLLRVREHEQAAHHLAHAPTAQAQSIYSPLYASDRGLLVFDQIPWFRVAERLEAENAAMLEERQKFQEMMEQQQVRGRGVERVHLGLGDCLVVRLGK